MTDAAPRPSSEGGAPEYMVSYADMITIMMAFFVVLYATTSGIGKDDRGHDAAAKATQEGKLSGGSGEGTSGRQGYGTGRQDAATGQPAAPAEQWQRIVESLNNRFGPGWTISNCWTGGPGTVRGSLADERPQQTTTHRGGLFARGLPGGNRQGIVTTDPGDDFAHSGWIFFDEGSATLTAEQEHKLATLAKELAGKLQKVEIRGHTSKRPLPSGGAYRDHLDLAYARCRAVQQCLVAHGIDARRLRLAVAGENEPVEARDDPVRQQRNSRVEVRLLNEWIQGRAEQP